MRDSASLQRLFPGTSEMAARMRELDWAATPLGSPEHWPEPLKHSVRLCLMSRTPVVIYWGDDLAMFHNDPCIPLLSAARHPFSLGRPGREAWGDAWHEMEPVLRQVMMTGEGASCRDQLVAVAPFTLDPILLDSGEVGGIFMRCAEVTDRMRPDSMRTPSRDELLMELADMTRLHALSTRLLSETSVDRVFEEVLEASMVLLGAEHGSVQLVDPNTGRLTIVAQRGFGREFLDYFNSVEQGSAAYGTALQRRQRVIVEDVLTHPLFADHRDVASDAGIRAVQSTPLFSPGGAPLGVISTHFRRPHRPSDRELRYLDLYASLAAAVIERQRVDEQLRASEDRFRRYFDIGLLGMAITTPDKRINEANAELCRLLGYSRDELLQMTWVDLTHPDDLAGDLGNYMRVMGGEIEGYSIDKRLICKDGRVIDAIKAARAVRRTDGSVDYVVAVVKDITERRIEEERRRQAEEALAEARLDLARIMRVTTMGELAASIAHEINQPLTAVITNAHACGHWLAYDPPDLREVSDAVARIVRDGNRAAEVIKRIRAFLARGSYDRSTTDVDEVIGEVIAMVSTELRMHAVTLTVVPHAPLAPVLADRVQLQQVVLNLVLNAVEAMIPITDRPRRIEIELSARDRCLLVAVRDSGVGVSPEHVERMFEAFHTTKPHGMGMGLPISRSIIEAHDGRLWATPNDGHGMTLQFTLPLAAPRHAELPEPSAQPLG